MPSLPRILQNCCDAQEVTPHDSEDLPHGICESLYIGNSGNVKVLTRCGTEVLFRGLQAGATLQLQVKRVFFNGTTATDIVAFYKGG